MNAGIDYGLGQANIDKETGIRFGVINANSVNPDILYEQQEMDYGEPHCPECGTEKGVLGEDGKAVFGTSAEVEPDAEWNTGEDFACAKCQQVFWSDECFPDEPNGWSVDLDGYKLTDCLYNDIFVLKSPYFTYAQFCSPCVPGAGNLDNPLDPPNGAKCYALGPDWFEDGKAPYQLFAVDTGLPCVA